MTVDFIGASIEMLLREIVDGPAGDSAFVLNPGDRGLLASLDALSAEAASARPGGRSSVASHVDHLRYGLELLNRWSRGDDSWAEANYAASWQRQEVDDEQWRSMRAALAVEARTWTVAAASREWDETALTIVIGSLMHLAYHLGAIRQSATAAIGPRASD